MSKLPTKSCVFVAALTVVFGMSNCLFAKASGDDEDMTIRPGIGIGDLHLGLKQAEINKVLGKPDGEYKLSNGIQAEYSEWKETNSVSTVRIFFGSDGKAVQIAYEHSGTEADSNDKLRTTDGITMSSTYADVIQKYKPLEHNDWLTKTGRVEYLDQQKRGIAFEFAGSPGQAAKKKLYAIVVHQPGKAVLPDANDRKL